MSGPAEKERADHLAQETARLRLWMAEVASSLAATEEQVANTLEKVAEHRSSLDAERLRAQASEARRYAVLERDRSTTWKMP